MYRQPSPPRPPSRHSTPQPTISRPPSPSSISQHSEAEAQSSSSGPQSLLDRISSLFHHSHIFRNITSFSTASRHRLPAHVSRRHNSDSDHQLPVVDVPCAHGAAVRFHVSHLFSHLTSNRGMSMRFNNKISPTVQTTS